MYIFSIIEILKIQRLVFHPKQWEKYSFARLFTVANFGAMPKISFLHLTTGHKWRLLILCPTG